MEVRICSNGFGKCYAAVLTLVPTTFIENYWTPHTVFAMRLGYPSVPLKTVRGLKRALKLMRELRGDGGMYAQQMVR